MRATSAGTRTLRNTVSQGSSVASWKTKPISDSAAGAEAPAMVAAPAVGGVSPARILSSVLLPQPLGPTSDTNSPLAMESETSSRARIVSPPDVR